MANRRADGVIECWSGYGSIETALGALKTPVDDRRLRQCKVSPKTAVSASSVDLTGRHTLFTAPSKREEVKYQAVGIILIAALAASCSAGERIGSTPPTMGGHVASAEPSVGSSPPEPSPGPSHEITLSCDDLRGEPASASETSIAGVLARDPRLTQFCTIVEGTFSPGLGLSWLEIWDWPASQMGDNQDGVTVFAPTNDAVAALDPALLTALEDGALDNQLLYSLIGRHYIHKLYPSTDFEDGTQRTWSGSGTVELSLDPLSYGGCNVIETDIRANNGYVHAIDCVVVPDEMAEAVAP